MLSRAVKQITKPGTFINAVARSFSSHTQDEQHSAEKLKLAQEAATQVPDHIWEQLKNRQVLSVEIGGATFAAHPNDPRFDLNKHFTTTLGGAASHGSSFEYLTEKSPSFAEQIELRRNAELANTGKGGNSR